MVKTINTMKKLHQLMGTTASQHPNGRIKFTHNNMNLKCKWAECPNQKTQTGKLDKKSKPISVLYSGDPSHVQRHMQTQRDGGRFTDGEQKKQKLQSQYLIKQTLNEQRSKETKRALHNGKGINATRRANYPKYICTQYRSTQILRLPHNNSGRL